MRSSALALAATLALGCSTVEERVERAQDLTQAFVEQIDLEGGAAALVRTGEALDLAVTDPESPIYGASVSLAAAALPAGTTSAILVLAPATATPPEHFAPIGPAIEVTLRDAADPDRVLATTTPAWLHLPTAGPVTDPRHLYTILRGHAGSWTPLDRVGVLTEATALTGLTPGFSLFVPVTSTSIGILPPPRERLFYALTNTSGILCGGREVTTAAWRKQLHYTLGDARISGFGFELRGPSEPSLVSADGQVQTGWPLPVSAPMVVDVGTLPEEQFLDLWLACSGDRYAFSYLATPERTLWATATHWHSREIVERSDCGWNRDLACTEYRGSVRLVFHLYFVDSNDRSTYAEAFFDGTITDAIWQVPR